MSQGPLNYRPSHAAVYYTPPRKLDVGRTTLGFLAAALLAVVGAVIYSKVQPQIQWDKLRGIALFVVAAGVGALGMIPVRFGRVQRPVVAAAIGALLALLTLYVMWVVWLHDVLLGYGASVPYARLAADPVALGELIKVVSQTGTWSYKDNVVRGLPLLICWLVEAGAIIAAGVLMPLQSMGGVDPICTACRSRCTPVPGLPRFADDRRDELVAAVERHDFAALAEHDAPAHDDDPELALRLFSCPSCGRTHVLTVNRFALAVDANGNPAMVTTPLVSQLLLPPPAAEQLRAVCREIVEERYAEAEDDDEEAPGTTTSTEGGA